MYERNVSIKPVDLPWVMRKRNKVEKKSYIPEINLHETLPYFCKKGIRSLGRQSYHQPQRRTKRYISYLIEKKTRFYYMLPKSSKSSKKYICKATDCTKIMENISRTHLNQSPLTTEISLQDGKTLSTNQIP